jgi:DNA-binding NarL/FixJ family response regulator
MGALRLLVASGNEIARKGLCALAREQRGWEIVAEACDGREAVERAKQIKPDVAIMDIDLPSLNGLEATRRIAKDALQTKVLLLAPHDTDQILPQILDAGAHGYLIKSDPVDDLVSAVEALSQGILFFTTKDARRILDEYSETLKKMGKAGDEDAGQLTGRQREILQLLAEGFSCKQLAVVLKISTKTAETHRVNLMKKIDCHSVAEVVRYAIRNHIIEA